MAWWFAQLVQFLVSWSPAIIAGGNGLLVLLVALLVITFFISTPLLATLRAIRKLNSASPPITTTKIQDLPVELLHEIVSYLSQDDALYFALTARGLSDVGLDRAWRTLPKGDIRLLLCLLPDA